MGHFCLVPLREIFLLEQKKTGIFNFSESYDCKQVVCVFVRYGTDLPYGKSRSFDF